MALTREPATSKRRVKATERQRQAIELRRSGASFDEIARQCGYSNRSGAYRAVTTALAKTLQEPAQEVRKLEAERLDELQQASWAMAKAGDHKAFDRVMRCLERRAALLGLDAPKRAQVLTAGVELTEDERLRIWQMLGLGGTPEPKEIPTLPCGLKELPGQGIQGESVVSSDHKAVTDIGGAAFVAGSPSIPSLADLERSLDEVAATLPK